MEGSATGGTLLPVARGMLDLDPSLHHPSLHHSQQALAHQLQGLVPLSTTQHVSASQDTEQSMGFEFRGTPKSSFTCNKVKSTCTSDEDEPSFTEDGGDLHSGGKSNKISPWQRMKWTDSMVRLLISVVMFVGDDGGIETTNGNNKRKAGLLQKKGKWKSVSQVMMERGCYVSPQQCEDKFNDLNKRYKRLNDILGRGTACSVVENPSLLDSMSNLSAKTKDDVKKLLSSKHLFYREMCSYHTGCKSSVSADLVFQPSIQSGMIVKSGDPMEFGRPLKDDNYMDDNDDDDDEDDDDEDGEEDDQEEEEHTCDDHDDEDGGDAEVEPLGDLSSIFGKSRKSCKYSGEGSFGPQLDQMKNINFGTVTNGHMLMRQEGSELMPEQQQWMRTRAMQLEEQKVELQSQAYELEKQRFKWQRFSRKKDQELERMKLENERVKLENERMSLQLKHKELEIELKRSEASMASIALILERLQSKEQNEIARSQ